MSMLSLLKTKNAVLTVPHCSHYRCCLMLWPFLSRGIVWGMGWGHECGRLEVKTVESRGSRMSQQAVRVWVLALRRAVTVQGPSIQDKAS